jgi:deoxycytidine triphosphate deaminase
MHLRSSKQFSKTIQNFTDQDSQLHNKSFDLTLDSVYSFTKPGSLDFGGSEFEPAATKIIDPKKNNSDDDYGWWKLQGGRYKAVFNERISLDEDMLAIITLHDHARQAGLVACTAFLTHGDTSIFTFVVPDMGCSIKENARLATAYLVYV